MRGRILHLFILSFMCASWVSAQCDPPLLVGTPSSFGYAMARAFGCDFYGAAHYYADNINSTFFTAHTSQTFMVGDIIMMAPINVDIGSINGSNGHAAYIAEIRSSGSGGDGPANPAAVAPGGGYGGDEDIIVHQISSLGDQYPVILTLAQLKSTRPGDVVKGFRRRKNHPDRITLARTGYTFDSNGNWTVTLTATSYSNATGTSTVIQPGDNWQWNWYFGSTLFAVTYASVNSVQLSKEIGSTGSVYARVVIPNEWTKNSSSLMLGQNTWVEIKPDGCSAQSSEWSVGFFINLYVDGNQVPLFGTYHYEARHIEYWNCSFAIGERLYAHLESEPANRYIIDGDLNKSGVPIMTRKVWGVVRFPSGNGVSSTQILLPDAFGCFTTCPGGVNSRFEEVPLPSITPNQFALRQNYPNPFNPETTISFELPEPAHVTITVFDVLGRTVEVLNDGNLRAGSHTVKWDAVNSEGKKVNTGTYFCRIVAKNAEGKEFQQVMGMVLTR